MLTQRLITFTALIAISGFAHAGFFGGGVSSNSSKSFDHRTDGFRVNFGSHINSALDLEFNYVDLGVSSYDDPNFITPDPSDEDDNGSFENIGYGDTSRSSGGLTYSGTSNIETFGVSAGLKLRKNINNWLQVFARASFLAWESTTEEFELYSEREPLDIEGDPVTDVADATNQNPCGTLDECRQSLGNKKHQALDFWYGYGLIIKPTSWLAIRAEYSIVTLNAVEFPKSVLEGLSTSLEIHF